MDLPSDTSIINLISTAIGNNSEIVNLFVGELPFQPPKRILTAIENELITSQQQTISSCHQYCEVRGASSLRNAISEYYSLHHNLTFEPCSEVLVTHGATEGIWLAISALTLPGDEVIIPDPCYMVYEPLTLLLGRKPIRVLIQPDDQREDRLMNFRNAISCRTRLLLLNSPANPTGMVCDRATLEDVIALAHEYCFYIVHDEVYDSLVYHGNHTPIVKINPNLSHTVMVNSISKRFGMGGWRLGWVVANPTVISTMANQHYYTNLAECTLIQRVISDFLNDDDIENQLAEQAKILYKRGQWFSQELQMLGIFDDQINTPDSGLYLFLKVNKLCEAVIDYGNNSVGTSTGETVAQYLLEKCKIAVGPGISFGPSGKDFIRISFAVQESSLNIALERLYNLFR